MKVILTSTLECTYKIDGIRYATMIADKNSLRSNIQKWWPEKANMLIICSDPDDYNNNDHTLNYTMDAFEMSGLNLIGISICDNRNTEIMDSFEGFNVLLFLGGHVPTQNSFMQKIGLKHHLDDYDGLILAFSAGSMNCADVVYAWPEIEGEGKNEEYERWIPGLGITNINILPHFQYYRDVLLDGENMVYDTAYKDSFVHEFIALNDGSYILIDEEVVIVGEAYKIKDGTETQICSDGEQIIYKGE